MRRLHPDHAVLLAALVGVAGLHVAAALLAPPLVPLAEAPAREGERVAVEARVLDVRHGERGRYVLLAADGWRLPALAGPGEGPAKGDEVRVVGIVTRLDDGPGLSLERVDVLRAAATIAIDVGDLARAPADHDGARVLVRGEARADWLVGAGARVKWTGPEPPERGREWHASGTFRYDASHAQYVLRVDAWTPPR